MPSPARRPSGCSTVAVCIWNSPRPAGNGGELKYRFDGKEKRLSLGVYPDVSLKDARDRRDALRKLLADGIDPSENRKATKSARADRVANSFEMVAREWFAKYAATWAANHSGRIIRRFERDIEMQQWADYLDKLKAGAEVIPLHGHMA